MYFSALTVVVGARRNISKAQMDRSANSSSLKFTGKRELCFFIEATTLLCGLQLLVGRINAKPVYTSGLALVHLQRNCADLPVSVVCN